MTYKLTVLRKFVQKFGMRMKLLLSHKTIHLKRKKNYRKSIDTLIWNQLIESKWFQNRFHLCGKHCKKVTLGDTN